MTLLGLKSFVGKTVFITGASRGIGKSIALAFGARGANVVVTGKTVDPHPKLPGTIHDTVSEITEVGGKGLAVEMNICDDQAIKIAVEKAVKTFNSPIDILINNASAISLTNTVNTTVKKFDLMHSVNVRGTFLTTQTCIPYLKESSIAHVINLSPPLDMRAFWFKNHVAYTIAKYGMSLCVLGMAEELKPHKISVNALWPRTAIATEAIKMLMGGSESYNVCRKPEILADCALLIASKPKGEVTGNFFIDETFMKENGVTNLDEYAVIPGTKDFMLDFFVPENLEILQKNELSSSDEETVSKSSTLKERSPEMQKMEEKFRRFVRNSDLDGFSGFLSFKIVFSDGDAEYWIGDFAKKVFYRELEPMESEMAVSITEKNFLDLMTGKVNPMNGYMSGKLKFKGSLADTKVLVKLWKTMVSSNA